MTAKRLLSLCLAIPFLMAAAPKGESGGDGPSGLPVPRFGSLRADEVNMRTGPGIQYPIEWIYKRQRLPIEVIAEYKTWRRIRDWEGAHGWVHQSMVALQRTVIVTGKMRILRAEPDVKGAAVAKLEPGVVGILQECPDAAGWCKVDFAGHVGWLRRVDFWGVHASETVK
ncbi:MAG: SH3 domain-containing protein [Magnetospirillum sp. WYHS-4]